MRSAHRSYGHRMRRHPALVGLSHDHHHALVAARRLRRAAEADGDSATAVASFVAFFAAETAAHFREEEEVFFPLVAESPEARALLVETLLDHQRLRSLVARLEEAPERDTMLAIAELLTSHVRREERDLFPLIERLAAQRLEQAPAGTPVRGGPLWGQASEDLNATLLAWPAGEGPAEHVNDERDVFIFVMTGGATVVIDDEERELASGDGLMICKGQRRVVRAGPRGVRYLSVHLRRPRLQIRSLDPQTS